MDTNLWTCFNDDVILPCFPNIAKEVTRCPVTYKILLSPVILKTDQGMGHLAAERRHRGNKKGLFILLGLLTGTVSTQEMDQGYGMLKAECVKNTIRVAAIKLA